MEAYGYDEKDRQYRLKWCDGSMLKYVDKIWGEEENNKLILFIHNLNGSKNRDSHNNSCSSLDTSDQSDSQTPRSSGPSSPHLNP